MHQTTLVVPCYNEEARLQVGVFQRFAAAHPHIRFVMVDDGSKERTPTATGTARRMFADPFRSRWIFDVELLARLIAAEGREAAIAQIYEMPFEAWSEVAGSKLKSGDFVKAVGELLGIYATHIRGGWSGSHPGEAGAGRESRRAA